MSAEPNPRLSEAVAEGLELLRAGDFEEAFHLLIDVDPAVAQPLIAAYRAETSRDVRSVLLRILWELRTPLAVPLLYEAVRDRRDERWKAALDGLVTIASAEAVEALELVLAEATATLRPDADYIDWVREALEQTREAVEAKLRAAETGLAPERGPLSPRILRRL